MFQAKQWEQDKRNLGIFKQLDFMLKKKWSLQVVKQHGVICVSYGESISSSFSKMPVSVTSQYRTIYFLKESNKIASQNCISIVKGETELHYHCVRELQCLFCEYMQCSLKNSIFFFFLMNEFTNFCSSRWFIWKENFAQTHNF